MTGIPTSRQPAAHSELRANWPLLLCCVLGISTSSISFYALGQFMAPLESEFGWSRSQTTVGPSIAMVFGFLISPLVGRLVDKINARLLVIVGLTLSGLGLASFSLATSNIGLWIALWIINAVVGVVVGPMVWLAVLSGTFDRYRSIAIAIALCGSNISTTFGPGVARFLLDGFGWRTSFQLLALIWLGPALILSLLFFFDRRDLSGSTAGADQPQPAADTRLRPIFLSSTFIRIALTVMVTIVLGSAYSIHLAPALAEKGLGLTDAAAVAGVAGIGAAAGKLVAGSLFDRFHTGMLIFLILALLAFSLSLLALESDSLALAILACALFGLASGAIYAVIMVVVAKFFSVGVFGVVYGVLTSIMALSGAIGPLAISVVFDTTGSYTPAFWMGVPVMLAAALLMQKLKPVGAAASRTD